MAGLDRDLALDRVQTMEQGLAESVSRPRQQVALVAIIMAGFGQGLSEIGVYGVVARSVARRTPSSTFVRPWARCPPVCCG